MTQFFLLLLFPRIDPVAVWIGPAPIRWYALAYICGLLFGWLLMRVLVRDDRLWGATARPTAESLDDLLVYATLGVVVGGRLFNVLFYGFDFYHAHPEQIAMVWNGGMAFHGGVIGVVVGMFLFSRRIHANFLTILDLVATVSPIGVFFGRIANFIRPEMWGRPSDVPWAMVFPGAGPLPRHPSQLYEAGLEGLALLVVMGLAARRGALRRPGLAAGLFGIGYGLARIVCEFFREPDPDLEALAHGLTMGMVLSAPMILAGVGLVVYALRPQRGEP